MKSVFPTELALLHASAGSPVDLARVQDSLMRKALEEIWVQCSSQARQLEAQSKQLAVLNTTLSRRTSQWSPPKANQYKDALQVPVPVGLARRVTYSSSNQMSNPYSPTPSLLEPAAIIDDATWAAEDTGIYETVDCTLCAFVVPSPTSQVSRPRTQVDLVLPPMIAFCMPGEFFRFWNTSLCIFLIPWWSYAGDDLLMHLPAFGKGSAQWPSVFACIKQTGPLWEAWKPGKSLDQMTVQSVWDCYNTGEAAVDATGRLPIGMKPPLRLVEQHFQSSWRKGPSVRPNSSTIYS